MILNVLEEFSKHINAQEFSSIFFLVSFLGGLVSSLSPCTIGILPIIIGYVGGYSTEKGIRTFIQMFFFVLGLSVVLTTVGIFCAIFGKVFTSVGGVYFSLFMASIILIFGLNLVGALEINFPVIVKQLPQNRNNNIVLYPFVLGCVFALASTPCSTPILAGIMGFATLSQNMAVAAVMLLLFSLGQGMIIVIAGVFTSLLKNLRSMASNTGILLKICGVLLILASFYMYWKIFSPLYE